MKLLTWLIVSLAVYLFALLLSPPEPSRPVSRLFMVALATCLVMYSLYAQFG